MDTKESHTRAKFAMRIEECVARSVVVRKNRAELYSTAANRHFYSRTAGSLSLSWNAACADAASGRFHMSKFWEGRSSNGKASNNLASAQ